MSHILCGVNIKAFVTFSLSITLDMLCECQSNFPSENMIVLLCINFFQKETKL